jgi:hypothetical protein
LPVDERGTGPATERSRRNEEEMRLLGEIIYFEGQQVDSADIECMALA